MLQEITLRGREQRDGAAYPSYRFYLEVKGDKELKVGNK